nr:MAG TPA: protein of unknown function (UPF0179) [Caudoviricetes sp.]
MGNESLIANLIAKCDQEIDSKCIIGNCEKCKYRRICVKVEILNQKFKMKGYLK